LTGECGESSRQVIFTDAGEHRHIRYFEVVQLLKGPGRAADVANTVLFLASEEARFITAEIINIDGGADGPPAAGEAGGERAPAPLNDVIMGVVEDGFFCMSPLMPSTA
jgi:hypothetical protein